MPCEIAVLGRIDYRPPLCTTSILKSMSAGTSIQNRLKSKVVPTPVLSRVDCVISRSLGIKLIAKRWQTAAGTVILSKYVRPSRPDYAQERSLIRIIYSNSMHFACRDRCSAGNLYRDYTLAHYIYRRIPGEISGELFATFPNTRQIFIIVGTMLIEGLIRSRNILLSENLICYFDEGIIYVNYNCG